MKFELALFAVYLLVVTAIYYIFDLDEITNFTPPKKQYSLEYFETFSDKQNFGLKFVDSLSFVFCIQYFVRIFMVVFKR